MNPAQLDIIPGGGIQHISSTPHKFPGHAALRCSMPGTFSANREVDLRAAFRFANLRKRFYSSKQSYEIIDNHNMNRFLWMAGNDKQRLRLALGLFLTLGGSPCLYDGTEVGLSQPRVKGPWREEARHPMMWGSAQDKALLAHTTRLIAARRAHRALVDGTLTTYLLDDTRGLWLFERCVGGDRVLAAVNIGDTAHIGELPAGVWVDLDGTSVGNRVTVPALSVTLWVEGSA